MDNKQKKLLRLTDEELFERTDEELEILSQEFWEARFEKTYNIIPKNTENFDYLYKSLYRKKMLTKLKILVKRGEKELFRHLIDTEPLTEKKRFNLEKCILEQEQYQLLNILAKKIGLTSSLQWRIFDTENIELAALFLKNSILSNFDEIYVWQEFIANGNHISLIEPFFLSLKTREIGSIYLNFIRASYRIGNHELVHILWEDMENNVKKYELSKMICLALENNDDEKINFEMLTTKQIGIVFEWAVRQNNLQWIKFILKNDLIVPNAYYLTRAIDSNNVRVVEYIYDWYCRSLSIEPSSLSNEELGGGLNYAINKGNLSISKLFIGWGAKITSLSIISSVKSTNNSLVSLVLNNVSDIEGIKKDLKVALKIAIQNNDLDIALNLLEKGATKPKKGIEQISTKMKKLLHKYD